jgi:uncharacterized LabA/DUF88 family protein
LGTFSFPLPQRKRPSDCRPKTGIYFSVREYAAQLRFPLLERLKMSFRLGRQVMRRVGVFVDAGYFWVQTTHVVLGARGLRSSVVIDYPVLRKELLSLVDAEFPASNLLRAYWYDGPGHAGKMQDHVEIERLDDFKLRLGTRNTAGSQKAVDGLIIADLIALAQAKAITDALLLSGDADLTPGMVAAQALGIRVHLLTMGPTAATSPHLSAEADRKAHWDGAIVMHFARTSASACMGVALPLQGAPAAAPTQRAHPPVASLQVSPGGANGPKEPQMPATAANTMSLDFDALAWDVASQCAPSQAAAIASAKMIPPAWDKRLVAATMATVGRQLTNGERIKLRTAFKAAASASAKNSSVSASSTH